MDEQIKGKKVLTVDDSGTIRNYLRRALGQRGAIVEGAETGQDAIDRLAAGPYDMVLLDLLLPDMDGLQVLRAIREKNQETTVVMLTGAGGIKSAMAAIQNGADGYLEKQDMASGDPNEFYYALGQAISHREGLVAQSQLQRVKADFYSMVTHDLRNPTGVIMLSVDSILEEEVGPVTEDQKEVLNVIKTASGQLLHLINEYLDFAKIDAGYLRLELDEADLRDVAQATARLAKYQAQAKEQSFTIDVPDEPVRARVDAKRLKQVVDNLVSNAIKYTQRGGEVRLSLAVEGGDGVFRVRDNGPGIPAVALPGLFAKYHRVPGETTRAVSGTGLGLLIVKEIVNAHGGTVHAESEGVAGKGSTFVARIPLAGAPAAA